MILTGIRNNHRQSMDKVCLPSPAVVLIAAVTENGNSHCHPAISQCLGGFCKAT